ncbi:MAG: thiamine phosphate synthase, partial [Pseudomonadota bacterium]
MNALRLYLVTDPDLCRTFGLVETVQAAVAGGVTMVQIRDKTATTAERTAMGRAVKSALAGQPIPVVMNDDIEAAVAAGLDGAHIGQDDITLEAARAALGPGKILGLSCETEATVRAADRTLVDYLGVGPVFATRTKSDHKPPIHFTGLRALCALTPLPTVAIGGLTAAHVAEVGAAGADGLAVVSAICGQPDPRAAA